MSLGFVGVPALLDTTTDASQLLRQSSRMLHYGHLVMLGIGGGDVDATRHHVTSAVRRGQNPWIIFVCEGLATIAIMSSTWTSMKGTHSRLFKLLE
jgi:hypothetical protein